MGSLSTEIAEIAEIAEIVTKKPTSIYVPSSTRKESHSDTCSCSSSRAQNLSFVLEGINKVKFEDRPIPEIKNPNDVLIQVKYTGICGSDVSTNQPNPSLPPSLFLSLSNSKLPLQLEPRTHSPPSLFLSAQSKSLVLTSFPQTRSTTGRTAPSAPTPSPPPWSSATNPPASSSRSARPSPPSSPATRWPWSPASPAGAACAAKTGNTTFAPTSPLPPRRPTTERWPGTTCCRRTFATNCPWG